MSVQALVKSLHMYQLRPSAGPINFDTLPHVETSGEADGFGYDTLIASDAPVSGGCRRHSPDRGGVVWW